MCGDGARVPPRLWMSDEEARATLSAYVCMGVLDLAEGVVKGSTATKPQINALGGPDCPFLDHAPAAEGAGIDQAYFPCRAPEQERT